MPDGASVALFGMLMWLAGVVPVWIAYRQEVARLDRLQQVELDRVESQKKAELHRYEGVIRDLGRENERLLARFEKSQEQLFERIEARDAERALRLDKEWEERVAQEDPIQEADEEWFKDPASVVPFDDDLKWEEQ